MNALAGAHDAAVPMIDTSIVRVHQHGALLTRNRSQSMGRSRGGLISKIHAVRATRSNGSSIKLNSVGGSRRATTSSRPTTWPSFSSHQYDLWLRVNEFTPLDGNGGNCVPLPAPPEQAQCP